MYNTYTMHETRPSDRPYTPEEAGLAAELYGLDTQMALELMTEVKETLQTFLRQVRHGAVVYDEIADKMCHGMINVMAEEFAKVVEEMEDSNAKAQLTATLLHEMQIELMIFVAEFDTWAVFDADTYEDILKDVGRILAVYDPTTRKEDLKGAVKDSYVQALEELVAFNSRDEYL